MTLADVLVLVLKGLAYAVLGSLVAVAAIFYVIGVVFTAVGRAVAR